MKQNITTEQWNELSDKSKTKLEKYFEKKGGCLYDRCLRIYWPNIGQMIEFLDENDEEWEKYISKEGGEWSVDSYFDTYVEEGEGIRFFLNKQKELCDALWLAVKKVLEK